jgi:exopolysaccharide biosynthesis polyprenyl glycosylphosphotransferase
MSAGLFGELEFIKASAAVTGAAFMAGGVIVLAPQIVKGLGVRAVHAAIGASAAPIEKAAGKVDLKAIVRDELARRAAAQAEGVAPAVKRSFDMLAAIFLLVALSPLLAATAAAIRLDSSGPILYRQRRIGLGGREFEIFKFRSMRQDAEKDGACWAEKDDKRVTRVGQFIRRTRIDEIPQAINILKGEMSFVGPRPERPEFVRLLETEIPHYHARHLVMPGITGWAQVRFVYTASVEGARDKLGYDLFYIKHMSPLLDALIVLMTVRVALLGLGSR